MVADSNVDTTLSCHRGDLCSRWRVSEHHAAMPATRLPRVSQHKTLPAWLAHPSNTAAGPQGMNHEADLIVEFCFCAALERVRCWAGVIVT